MNRTTIGDLIATLQDIADSHDEGLDMEVRLAQQPRWAFEYRIENIAAMPAKRGEPAVCYIAEGTQLGYLPHAAAVAVDWAEARDGDDDDDDQDDDDAQAARVLALAAAINDCPHCERGDCTPYQHVTNPKGASK